MDSSSIRSRAASEASRVNGPLGELVSSVNAMDGDLRVAESTLELFAQASFPLKQDESYVLAIRGKLMKGEKSDGTLYFTNQRFVFEGKKEIVLEKKFFIATKKKTERKVLIDQPIGALQEISRGRVGLIAWTGIYVRFKPERRLEEAPFDVEGWEADAIERFFDYIIKGEADKDIAAIKGTTATTAPFIQVVTCSRCGAPYNREVYKGQTSVMCEYCGTQIVIKQS
jgi:DNA-directed RNA polymerase subunit RPC12/RpoP